MSKRGLMHAAVLLLTLSLHVVSSVAKSGHWTLSEEGPQVSTKYGKVGGLYVDNVAVYYGLPFASPPVGQLRWQTPQPPKAWGSDTAYNATFMRPSCPQTHCDLFAPSYVCPTQISEDCLYLDIFTPKDASVNTSIGYPVMVFIHGGNFVRMSGSTPLYDGRVLAGTRGVILVNINYRIGALGFLVTGRSDNDAKGNYGIQDQQAALQWVQDNIRDFGGDPSKVTLFGESAGAQSALLHYTLASSAPLFRNAIIESSPIAIPYKRFAEAVVVSSLLAELVGCQPGDINCLRSKSATDIVQAQYKTLSKIASFKLLEQFEPWGPYVDGDFIKSEHLEVLGRGDFSPKPLIIGTVSEETVVYIYSAWNKSVSTARYEEVPPWSNSSDQREAMVRLSTDFVFACPTRNATRIIRSRGQPDVWLYVWDHAFSFQGWGHITECEGRVCHGSELVYVFHSAWAGNFTFQQDEEVLSGLIMDYWTNFAKSGNPNNGGSSAGSEKHGSGRISKRVKSGEVSSFDEHGKRSSGKIRFALSENFHHNNDAGGRLSETMSHQADEKWPAYDASGNWPNFRFKSPAGEVEVNYKGDNCDFWDTIGYAA